jgi:hypothetical protein
MLMTIRWVLDTVELGQFPGRTQRHLLQLLPGTFTAIGISPDTQLFVKRVTNRAFQLGVNYGNSRG